MSKNNQPTIIDAQADEEEGRVVEGSEITALAQLNSAEINQQIMTARAFPRSIVGFRRNMREMVTYDQATALSCLYALKRGNKPIEGPSIRFAEAAVQAWGNARCGARVIDVGDEFITAQGFFYDLEKNMAIAVEVMRRITNSEGHRYGDDMIGVTGNAACSIGLRNAILRGVPRTAWQDPYQAARELSVGKGESISVKRDNMVRAFAPVGVSKEQIYGLLGVKGQDDISYDNLMFLAGILNSIKEGTEKTEVVFAMENMVNPDQVRPRAPARSEFKNESASAGKKTDPVKITEPQTEASEGEKGGADDRMDFIKDAYDELERQTKIIDNKNGTGVSPLRERVIEAGVLSADEQKAWEDACDAKNKSIMAAARAR